MATITPHHHHVRFTLCHHTYRKYVFYPDPADPTRCICSKIDATKHPFEESVPGQSGIVFHRVFKQRIVRGRCRYCIAEADARIAAATIEDSWATPPWPGENNGGMVWDASGHEDCGFLKLDGTNEFGESTLDPPNTLDDKGKDRIEDSDVKDTRTSAKYIAV
ncbi:hypothetical protein AA313_de0205847 [Arthrobotrys entomopaga]|nr:hypothetical protein AA313_de0205847 [Arthrobotrys entomopaga]